MADFLLIFYKQMTSTKSCRHVSNIEALEMSGCEIKALKTLNLSCCYRPYPEQEGRNATQREWLAF
jgi:hypothetical protein